MKTKFASLQQKRFRLCGVLVACGIATSFASAQSPKPRIAAEITNSSPAAIKGSLHPLAQAQNDAGRMPADTRLNGVSLYFNRSAAQQADLEALIAAQQDPSSSSFHKWLTPDQFAARFGMAQSDLDRVQSWLQQQGFAISSVARSRNMIRFSGTASQVEAAFSTQMHYYQAKGERHFAPATALSVPAGMAPAVLGIRNLDDFRPKAQAVKPRANFTSGQSHNVFFAPGDIATTYDVQPLYAASENGAGQTIAVAGQTTITVGDIEAFQSAAGLPKKDPNLVLVPGTGDAAPLTNGGDQGESDIDVEWAGAMAPGANILFVYTGNDTTFGVYDSVQYAVDELLAPIISLSYDSCETELSASNLTTLEAIFSQAATQGQTVLVASGDQGANACSGDTHLTAAQQQAVAVNYPASSAFVTGMGGTEISAANSSSTNTTYWAGGSTNTDTLTSALTYIPEVAWNDSSSNGLSASGGGASALVNRPSWQTGVAGIASGTMRLVPDISLYSSPNLPGYLYCTSDTANWNTTTAPVQQASCNQGFRDSATGTLTVAGGTSFAAPIFAGMVAIINQKAGYVTGQGLINPTLYKLAANSTTYASAFHDVTSGNNNCTGGTSLCSSTTGFSAGTGYDEVTGLGSIDLNNLVSAWTNSTTTLIGTSTTVVPATAAPLVNIADVFTITVTSNTGTTIPTGTVTLQIDAGTTAAVTVANQAVTANGTVTYSATFASAGAHQIVAQYSGDATHAASTGVGSVTIAGTSSGKGTFTLGAAPSTLTVKQGSSGSSTITVTPAGGYTGTVLISFATSNDTALGNLCYSFTNTTSSGAGSVAVTGTTAVTTQFTLDANASDCSSTTGGSKPGVHSLRSLRAGGSASRGPVPNPAPNRLPAEAAFAGLVLAGFMGRYARKFRSAAWVIALAAAGLAMSACGSSTINNKVPNPPKGPYTVTLTGNDSVTAANKATATFSFVIN
jgi:subtilase family serine protease